MNFPKSCKLAMTSEMAGIRYTFHTSKHEKALCEPLAHHEYNVITFVKCGCSVCEYTLATYR